MQNQVKIVFTSNKIERSDDRNTYAKSSFLAHNAGSDGRLGMVQSQLFNGVAVELGERPRMHVCYEKLQRLDLCARSEVKLQQAEKAKLNHYPNNTWFFLHFPEVVRFIHSVQK